MENIYFDLNRLKHLGKNVIIGKCVRIRYPERVVIDDYAIIDDFTYISTKLTVGKFVHIGANSVIQGGQGECSFADFSGCSPGCKIITCSDDYIGGLACPQIPPKFKGNMIVGTVTLKKHALLGTGTVVLPNIIIEEGAATGAMTLVNKNLEAWKLYAGNPARFAKERNKDQILKLEAEFWEEYYKNGETII
jgi:acetyltransferase-like isoleucine patch superfamily enzyme